MKALVLDFDGVIAQSAREAFAVALRTYAELRPDTPLAHAERERLYAGFLELMPLGNRAEDYGISLAALEQNAALPDQSAYDAFHAAQDRDWLRAYHKQFYRVRAALAAEDPAGWRRLLPPYPGLEACLRRHAGTVSYAIATAKDRRSVRTLLADYGIADLFDEALVHDKETGVSKAEHLARLQQQLELEYPEMTFVDDKVNHLDSVAPLGVRCVLAAWGYNGPREHELARARGHLVCSLEDFESRVFGRNARGNGAGNDDGRTR